MGVIIITSQTKAPRQYKGTFYVNYPFLATFEGKECFLAISLEDGDPLEAYNKRESYFSYANDYPGEKAENATEEEVRSFLEEALLFFKIIYPKIEEIRDAKHNPRVIYIEEGIDASIDGTSHSYDV